MGKQCYFEGGVENQHSDEHVGRMEDCQDCQEAFKGEGYKYRWCDDKIKVVDDVKKFTDQIFDTIMQNVGMSENHTAFPAESMDYQQVDSDKREIYFRIGENAYLVTVKKVDAWDNKE